MKLLKFTIIKLTICLILGIILGYSFNIDFIFTIYITIGLVILLGAYWLTIKQKINKTSFFSLLTYTSMIAIGINAYNIQNETSHPQHYTNLSLDDSYRSLTFKIEKRLKPDSYNDKYIVSLSSLDNRIVNGKLLINVKRDSLSKAIPVDAVVLTSSQLKIIQKPLNPYQFDYAKYLERQHIYHQIYIEPEDLFYISNSKTSIYGFAYQLRTNINKKLIKAGFKGDVLDIMNALLLGQRQDISKATYNNYVNSGTIHILAVSGLHVGILLWILNFIFKPLERIKYGNFLKGIVILIILWSFAIVAGLSPSVTRAVSMFSVISIAMHLKRPTNIYNTLAISAFFILLVRPNFLFEVGFQMSYFAVIGIVSIQPIIYKLWRSKYWIIDKPWQIFTVTLAAQIGVLPISLFYFHQFPGLFFISNLVVIPFLGVILGLGILIIALALINQLPSVLVDLYSYIIESLNNFIAWVAQFENFLLRDIPYTLSQVLLSYLVIIALVQVYKFKTFKWVAVCLIGIIGYQSILFYNQSLTKSHAFIVFNKSRFTMIGQKQNDKLLVHHNLDSIKLNNDNVIKNYKVGELISDLQIDSLASIYQFKNQKLLIVDSLGIYKNLSFKPKYVLLRNSPKINLNRLIDSLQPMQIIADASNFKSYVKRWKATCIKRKTLFHYTNEKGAFIIE